MSTSMIIPYLRRFAKPLVILCAIFLIAIIAAGAQFDSIQVYLTSGETRLHIEANKER